MKVVAGIDLGGTAINYTFLTCDITSSGKTSNSKNGPEFLISGLCEHPARAKEGPEVCLQQIQDGFMLALKTASLSPSDVVGVGLDTPGPSSSQGVLSARGSTNFVHQKWAGFDIRLALEHKLNLPTSYLNDGNAAALWGHFSLFGQGGPNANPSNQAAGRQTSVSAIIGTGLGGGVVVDGQTVICGRKGFGGELGHVLIPYQSIQGLNDLTGDFRPSCNCGRMGDLESLCSLTAISKNLLPYFLKKNPHHELAQTKDISTASKLVRGLAEKNDPLCKEIFRIQAHALGLFFDIMINTFDPDVLIVGGGAVETSSEFQTWFLSEIKKGMPNQREEQADIPIVVMPNGDTAGARGAALQARMGYLK